jgi:Flp pilus assembly protein TadD
MPNLPTPGALRRLLIPILLLSAAAPTLAQAPAGAIVQPLSSSSDPAELLAQALRTLATEPNNLAALIAAGHNAVILGDPNAAVGFFGRAQEIAPNDGPVKAGLGSALVQLEKPQDALRLFAQASRLGVPDADLAEDRGLAYDLTGDQRRAQADYQTVLAARPNDDTARRRLALSQGISGQKAAAIATLDPLIRKRDIAAWRAQTFVLAMDGDAKGANDITRIMLPQQATMLQPFLVRLSTLSPADKARAVHFGEMPATGATYTPTQVASVDTPATYASAPVRQPAPAPRSDLAPPVKPTPRPMPAPVTAVPTQIVVATPKPIEPQRPTPTPTSAQPSYNAAPLADIALTPANPVPRPAATVTAATAGPPSTPVPSATPTPTSPAPRPAVQLAQAAPLRPEVAGPPAPPPSELPPAVLPTPAAEGHYDLPHDAATRGVSHPARPAPAAVPAPMKTVGTPVVHGKTGTDTDDTTAPLPMKKTAKPPAKAELASTDDSDTKPAKTRTGRASARDAAADTTSAKGAKTKLADADDEDCTPVPAARGKHRTRAGAKAKPSAACTKLASATDDSDTGTKGKKGASAKLSTVDDEDCAPAPASKSKRHSRTSAKTKPSTACTSLASAADDSDTGTTAKKGTRSKASAAAEADDSKATSSKSGRSARAVSDKATAERVYVQVAGGANKDDMAKAWVNVKKKAPELMKGRTPSTTPIKATNRLLVGPFKDEAEAQAFVNKMAGKGLSGFTVKSGKGQKVETVGADQ